MKFINDNNPRRFLNIASIIFVVLVEILYFWLSRKIEGADVNLVRREIETSDKLALNGYLSHFFRFKHFGIMNLMVLPILLRDLLNFRKLKNWQKGFIFIYVTSLILIGVKGFFNPRYAMTIFPVTVGYLIFSLHTILINKKFYRIAKLTPFYIIGIGVFFFIQQQVFDRLTNTFSEKYLMRQDYSGVSNGPKLKYKGCNNDFFAWRMAKAIVLDNYPNYRTNKNFDKNCMTFSQREIFDFIQYVADRDSLNFLTNNLPAIYYFTDVKSIYYWAGDDLIFDDKGRRPLFSTRETLEIKSYLKDSLNVGYIYSYEPYNHYNEHFYNFLKDECDLIIQNYSTFQIFRIRED